MRLARRLPLVCAALALVLTTARPAVAQGSLYGIVEAPAINGTVAEPFQIRGWAFWSGAPSGSGIDAVQIYGCPINNCPSQPLWGAATIGLARPDVVTAYGYPAGANAGYSFTMSGLAPDVYYVTVWTHTASTGAWLPFTTSFTVTSAPEHVLEHPTPGQSVAQPFTVSGWAIDAAAPTGTGVDIIGVNAYHNFGSGAPAYALGGATYGDARSDVAAARGARFLNSGYHFTVTGQPSGWYRFVTYAHSPASGLWTGRTVDAYVDIPTASLQINRSGTGTGAIVATGLSCPGGSNTQAMPCGASYAFGTAVTLTAVPDPGSTFAGWGGGCAPGPNPVCTVGLSGDRFAFAYFTKTPGTIATTYYHTDAIGSVRALSDQTGATVIRHDYLPFGEDTQPLTGDPLRFAGKELDPESALMNFEARYYRNTWGRFTQVDPMGGSLTDPQRWNRYAYAGNNPLRFTDDSGLSYEGSWIEQSGTYFHQQPFYFVLDNNFFSWLAVNHWHIYNCATCDGEIVDDASGNHVGSYSYFPSPDASHPPPGGGDSGSGSGSDGSGGGSTLPTPPPPGPPPPAPPPGPPTPPPPLPPCGANCDPTPVPLLKKVVSCTAEQLGLHSLFGPSAVYAGKPIPGTKRFVMQDAEEGTSWAGKGARWLFGDLKFESAMPTLVGGPFARKALRISFTKSVGTFAGRAVPVLGWALISYDLVSIAACSAR